ncbi:6126_t:CDS:2, partial [Cetraspora pellucida]
MFLGTPKFNKKLIFKNPSNLYENFCNAYAYYLAISIGTPSSKKQDIFIKAQEGWKTIRNLNEETIQNKINNYLQTPLKPIQYTSFMPTLVISNKITKQECIEKQLNKLNELQKLKKHAAAQVKSQAKKREALKTRREAIRYDSLGHPFFLLLNPDLPEQMHSYIKFGIAAKK